MRTRRLAGTLILLSSLIPGLAHAQEAGFNAWSVGGSGELEATWQSASESAFFVINLGPGEVELIVDDVRRATARRRGVLSDSLKAHQSVVLHGRTLRVRPASSEEAKGLVKVGRGLISQ